MQLVADKIERIDPHFPVDLVEVDLSFQASIRGAAATVSKITDRLDVMINTAGIVTSDRRETAEGIELQFGMTIPRLCATNFDNDTNSVRHEPHRASFAGTAPYAAAALCCEAQ
jgi:NAD(P)-dependent dehydrogenase (short-subunit alcohol dehydrogenase family)